MNFLSEKNVFSKSAILIIGLLLSGCQTTQQVHNVSHKSDAKEKQFQMPVMKGYCRVKENQNHYVGFKQVIEQLEKNKRDFDVNLWFTSCHRYTYESGFLGIFNYQNIPEEQYKRKEILDYYENRKENKKYERFSLYRDQEMYVFREIDIMAGGKKSKKFKRTIAISEHNGNEMRIVIWAHDRVAKKEENFIIKFKETFDEFRKLNP